MEEINCQVYLFFINEYYIIGAWTFKHRVHP